MTYFQNGAIRHVTAGVAAGLQLYLDSAFRTVGGRITNLTFAGTGADGINAMTVSATPTALTVACDSSGTVRSGEFDKYAQLQVVVAAADQTMAATYSLAPTGCSAMISNAGGSQGKVTFTAVGTDHAYVDVTVTLDAYAPVVQRITLDKVRDGGSGAPGTTPYAATRLGGLGTTPYVGDVVVANGATVTLHAEVVITAVGGSPVMTLTAQYSTDGATFLDMTDGTTSETIGHGDTNGLGVDATYTNTSGAQQILSFQTILSNAGGTPSIGGGYMQPSLG